MYNRSDNNSRTFFNYRNLRHRTNTVTPESRGGIWLQDEPAVEIVELNSSDVTTEPQQQQWSHVWSYVENDRFHDPDDYRINQRARERRRLKLSNSRQAAGSFTNEEIGDSAHNSANISRNKTMEQVTLNHQMNYFTIYNKNFVNSDTSTDDDPEMCKSGDNSERNILYDEEIVTHDSNIDTEPRTVWIYSFKNKRLLSDNDLELGNIAGKDDSTTSTSYSVESDDEGSRDKCYGVNYPVSTYVPRLNLALNPALPTVTEIAEPMKQYSDECADVPENRFGKVRNSWVIDSNNNSGRSYTKQFEQSTNIVNWMALSPRERRRRPTHLTDIWKGPQSILKISTPPANEERSIKLRKLHEKSTNIVNWMALSPREKRRRSNDFTDKWKAPQGSLHLGEARRLRSEQQVIVDVHFNENEEIPKNTVLMSSKSDTVILENKNDLDIITQSDSGPTDQAKGDHEMKLSYRPRIVLPSKYKVNTTKITDPIEKLDGNWIHEESCEKEIDSHDYRQDTVDSATSEPTVNDNNKADTIWIKNTKSLMKPAHWNEYLPITETPASLQISLSSIGDIKPQSWKRIKRFVKCITCCK